MSRKYYSERLGRNEPGDLTPAALATAFQVNERKFTDEGYFQAAFGYECVDAGYVLGDRGMKRDEHMELRFGERSFDLGGQDLDDIFDLIEYYYDHVAEPVQYSHHTFADCGIHVGEGDYEAGKEAWREEWNKILSRMDPPYRLSQQGEIEKLPDEGVRQLVDERTEYGDTENVDDRVDRACRLFFGRHASIEDQRDALRELADVLEFLRSEIEDELPNREANRLFDIANNFGIRHHNENQETDYNRGAYYPWIFHAYLATIDLLGRLRADAEEASPETVD